MHPFILPAFQGPIDLLVLLVQRDELNIFDLSIKDLIAQYIKNRQGSDIDSEIATLCDMSTLVQHKTKSLLPSYILEEEEPEEAPPINFLQHLIEYASFKTIAETLSNKEEAEQTHFSRGYEESLPQEPPKYTSVSLQDFATAFAKVLKEAERKKFLIGKERWTVEDKIQQIKEMTIHQSMTFQELFSLDHPREELIVTFLAILELLKQQFLRLTRKSDEIVITSRKREEESTYENECADKKEVKV